MEENLLELINNISTFLTYGLDVDDKFAVDKKRLFTEVHSLRLLTQECLESLSKDCINENEAYVDYFRLVKKWYWHLLLLITYINYTPCVDRSDKSAYIRHLGEELLSSISEINYMDVIDPSERFVVLVGGTLNKKMENNSQGSTEQQAPKDSDPSARFHPSSNFGQRTSNNHSNFQRPNRSWNNRQGNNKMNRSGQRWP
ncbi:unnamed protein product [Rodentolepis nana]|uniref:Exosome complex component RRP42 n=1 Tax=Rodentolepis nana TaxID=102285 RepID=A0A0R3TL97_RODNA|nr:unnamed protein product [Rodentolepis nana]